MNDYNFNSGLPIGIDPLARAQSAKAVATLPNKADLIDGFVPASQIAGQTLEIKPVDTYDDLPAEGSPNHLYVVRDENNQQYRWDGTGYIKAGEKDAYYAAEVMWLTTMGELRQFIEGINTQQLHVLLDMHTYITDAYVCTAHFYTSGGVQHCEIFDALNSQIIAGSFADTDTIAEFVAEGKSKLVTMADVDAAPTQGSTNPVTSGGVWNAIKGERVLLYNDPTMESVAAGTVLVAASAAIYDEYIVSCYQGADSVDTYLKRNSSVLCLAYENTFISWRKITHTDAGGIVAGAAYYRGNSAGGPVANWCRPYKVYGIRH